MVGQNIIMLSSLLKRYCEVRTKHVWFIKCIMILNPHYFSFKEEIIQILIFLIFNVRVYT